VLDARRTVTTTRPLSGRGLLSPSVGFSALAMISIMPDLEITLVPIKSPTTVQDARIVLPVTMRLSEAFWADYDLPDADLVLNTLTLGTESAPRIYLAGQRDAPAEWTPAPVTVVAPEFQEDPGPGVLHVSGAMTDELRSAVERTELVITFAEPGVYRLRKSHPVEVWDRIEWHTVVLVPRR